jgi:hypothetical protein
MRVRVCVTVFSILVSIGLLGCDRRTITISKITDDRQRFVGLSYFLPRGLVPVTISQKEDEGLTMSIGEVQYVPDPEHHYRVKLHHNLFYEDEIKVALTSDGLLDGINTTTKDETPAIIRKIANAPLEIVGKQASAAAGQEHKYFSIKYTVDPTDANSVYQLNEILRRLQRGITFNARPLVRVRSNQRRGDPAHYHPDCDSDICFRTAMPYVLQLQSNETGDLETEVVAQTIVVLPNKHVVGSVRLDRAAFVTKKLNLDFTNGMLKDIDLHNPSEVLAFIQIPIDVAKAIVSIPSAMLDFKVTNIEADTKLLTAQKDNLDLQRQLIETQNKFAAAQNAEKG